MTPPSLAAWQHALHLAVKGRGVDLPPVDPERLALAREVVVWWYEFVLERGLPLTAAFLNRSGRFSGLVARALRELPLSPWQPRMVEDFVTWAIGLEDEAPLPSLVLFERALVRAKRDPSAADETIEWPMDPVHVLDVAVGRRAVDPERYRGRYVTYVSPRLEGLFRIGRIVEAASERPDGGSLPTP